MTCELVHVVRRYGPVGGMERYVWELTQELVLLGHQVTVVCERCHADKPAGMKVVELGKVAPRPRWLALLRFSRRVSCWLRDHPNADRLVHSHERLSLHHITTFHGPPFATIFERPWWRWLSLRVVMQLYLERRELSRPQFVVPNSPFIKQSIAHYYPQLAYKLTEPVVPGVVPGAVREPRVVLPQGGIVGFVGKEWQRKGLPWAVKVVAALRDKRQDLQLYVVGPDAAEVAHLFADWQGGYQLVGWSAQAPYPAFDVLLHPARAEPYGMVISEAMSARVPVVISDVCGAATHVNDASGLVLPLTAPLEAWVQAVDQQLCRVEVVPQFERPWRTVAEETVCIYADILAKNHLPAE
ncbi:glycosyltransferase family 4 protein [Rhodoferax fermentans]|uniref:Glycosyl transferase family 1 n=1 Tax=Rhodoferax fermentans TaxID=28066 RepID=A0A1T1AV46_RHOFE|nr:glycosyltransferase family 4 protein [Rhodoferax fermentans]MBK1681984.1 glycosyl transferase family 1 [Rhodoferax fermentans]OOV07979.1 glycosyl transferase family 1 [Rhodoferax fermentans]